MEYSYSHTHTHAVRNSRIRFSIVQLQLCLKQSYRLLSMREESCNKEFLRLYLCPLLFSLPLSLPLSAVFLQFPFSVFSISLSRCLLPFSPHRLFNRAAPIDHSIIHRFCSFASFNTQLQLYSYAYSHSY